MFYIDSVIFIGLYVSGILVGKNRYVKVAGDYFQYVVFSLIFIMAMWAGYSLSTSSLASLALFSLIYSIIIIFTTYIIGIALNFSLTFRNYKVEKVKTQFQWKYLLVFILGLVAGVSKLNLPYDLLIQYMLYILAFVAGVSIRGFLTKEILLKSLTSSIYSVVIAFSGAVVASVLLYFLGLRPFQLSLGVSIANGWYSFAGPFLGLYYGSSAGVIGFLTNFLREQLTFIIVPTLARILPLPEPLIAIGGATSMDTTLGVYMGVLNSKKDSITAIVSGVIITILVPIVLPISVIFK
ncbi:MAG: lysine exporter LysO family protein [Sulfolobaceae archaeon]|nr:lysine exporter LysO family protein [Sulfolobaceae archaeon]